jgi:hypothetical protein
VEWYLSGPPGLEQGFDLAARPEGEGALVLELELAGEGLAPRLVAGGTRVELADGQGEVRLHYRDLYAQDADGVELAARMELEGRTLRLVVDDTAARYPIQVDPLVVVQEARLRVLDQVAGSHFGFSVALAGDTLVVGTRRDDDRGTNSGSAYIFLRSGTTWTLQRKLTASDGAVGDEFGSSVSISGETVVVGAHLDDDRGVDSGSVYVFVRSGTSWSQQAKLTASDGATGDWFGSAVSLSGETVVVGAPESYTNNRGAAYVFVRSGTSWSQQAKLTASDGADDDEFGYSVAISNNTLAVAAPFGREPGCSPGYCFEIGTAYVFVRSGGNWVQQARLHPGHYYSSHSVSLVGDTLVMAGNGHVTVYTRAGTTWNWHFYDGCYFPASLSSTQSTFVCARKVYSRTASSWVLQATLADGSIPAIDGNTIALGDPLDDSPATDAGSVRVFVRSGTDWSQQAALVALYGAPGAQTFGTSLAVDGDRAVVGMPGDSARGSQAGSAYVFLRAGTSWTLQQKLLASDGAAGDGFGGSVSISGDSILVGADGDDDRGSNSGSAYAFRWDGAAWVQEAKIVPADGAAEDRFGWSVSLAWNRAAIGTPYDDDRGTDSGSVYVFLRSSSGAWSQNIKHLASDGAAGDRFGAAVALLSPTSMENNLLIGAPGDDDRGTDSGSAYVFNRSNLIGWTQSAKLTASDGQAGDAFGYSVGLNSAGSPPNIQTRAVVGAPGDDDRGSNSGSAYVFLAGNPWTQEAKLTASDGVAGDELGRSVSIHQDTIAVGAELDDDRGSNSGSAYLFVRMGTGWTDQTKLVPADLVAGDSFGRAVALVGTTLLVGGGNQTHLNGVAYAFRITGAADGTPCPGTYACASGFCVDGVCCNTACAGGSADCQACSQAAGGPVNGICSFLPSSAVCRAAAGECDLAESCTGSGAACPTNAFRPNTYTCRASAGVCDLAENCTGSGAACPANAFRPSTHECRASAGVCDLTENCTGASAACPSDAFRPGSYECRASAGVCDLAENCTGSGAACPADGFRPSTHECRASAGVCDVAERCTGTAPACPLDAFLPSSTECRASAGVCDVAERCTGAGPACPLDEFLPSSTECRTAAGVCDAAERCTGTAPACPADAFLPSSTECRPAACAAGVAVEAASCTGGGADCPPSGETSCGAYACVGNACATSCASRADCAPGYYCDGAGQCLAAADLGTVCAADAECFTELCVDGVCCDQTCEGPCEACDLAGHLGECSPVTGAPRGGRPACLGEDGDPCQGACDGEARDACAYPGAETACREASCTDGVATLAASCRGDGACPALETQACAPYACEGTACAGDCATDEDCALGMTCSAGVCVERRPQGEACTAAGQCQSGQCVDGVCCDASCAGQCEACDLAGRLGTCSPVEGAPRGGRSACAGSAPCQGACDGEARQACAYPGSEVECGAASCRDGVETAAATCDGAGGCPAGETRACGACGCGPDGVCLETCGGDQPAESGCGCGAGGKDGLGGLLLFGLAGIWLGRGWRARRAQDR